MDQADKVGVLDQGNRVAVNADTVGSLQIYGCLDTNDTPTRLAWSK